MPEPTAEAEDESIEVFHLDRESPEPGGDEAVEGGGASDLRGLDIETQRRFHLLCLWARWVEEVPAGARPIRSIHPVEP